MIKVLEPINKKAIDYYDKFLIGYEVITGVYQIVEGQNSESYAKHAKEILEKQDNRQYAILLRETCNWAEWSDTEKMYVWKNDSVYDKLRQW